MTLNGCISKLYLAYTLHWLHILQDLMKLNECISRLSSRITYRMVLHILTGKRALASTA